MSEIHIIPRSDLIEHDTSCDDACLCGPTLECVSTERGDAWRVIHHSLDGREHSEPHHDRVACPLCSTAL